MTDRVTSLNWHFDVCLPFDMPRWFGGTLLKWKASRQTAKPPADVHQINFGGTHIPLTHSPSNSFGAHRTRSDAIINRLIAQCIPHQSLLSLNRCLATRATTANTEADTDKIRDIIALSNGEARNFVELMNVKTAGVFFLLFRRFIAQYIGAN